MTDIVERLNEWEMEGRYRGNVDLWATLSDAKAEIERLRAALENMARHPTGGVGCNPVEFVRAANIALNVPAAAIRARGDNPSPVADKPLTDSDQITD